jgi:hypothetical protein
MDIPNSAVETLAHLEGRIDEIPPEDGGIFTTPATRTITAGGGLGRGQPTTDAKGDVLGL